MNLTHAAAIIAQAINNHQQLTIVYLGDDAEPRVVNPYYVGLLGDTLTLHAFQKSGSSASHKSIGWKNFSLSKILSVDRLAKHFSPPDVGYNTNPDENHYRDLIVEIIF